MCTDVTRPDKYLLSTGYFIIVHTQLFLLFYIVINKKNLIDIRYIYRNKYFYEKSDVDTNYLFNRNSV